MASLQTLSQHGLAGAIGVFIAYWGAEAYHWHGYMQANPNVGTVSGGNELIYAVLIIGGLTFAYTAFARGLKQ